MFPILKILGATGLLIEYEDMFPYQKPIEHLSATNTYSESEIRELLKAATCKCYVLIYKIDFVL